MREVTDSNIIAMLEKGGDQPEQAAAPRPMSWGDAAASAVGNIPSSAVQLAENIAYPFAHPVEFGKGIGKLITGDDEAVGALGDFLVNRYGGEEQLKQTVANDPVGFLSDVALVFTGVGAGVKGAAALGSSAKLASVGRGLSKVGAVADPINAAASGAGAVVAGVGKVAPKLSPEGLVVSTLKKGALSSKVTPDQQVAAAGTILKRDIPISQRGLEMTSGLLDDLSARIDSVVEGVSAAGDTIPRKAILKSLDEMKSPKGLYYHTADRAAHFKTIDKVMDNVRNNYPEQIPVADVQKIKQNTQAWVSKNYGKLTSTPIEARKSLAHGAREALAEKYPELAALNAESRELIELQKILEPAVQRIASRDVMGIGLPVKVGAGAAIDSVAGTGGAGATVGLVSGVIDTPAVKSWVARTLYKLRQGKMTERKPAPYAVREASRQAGQTNRQGQDQLEPLPYSP